MSIHPDRRPADPVEAGGHAGHRGHGWMMIACCMPMLVIAIALVAAGVVSPGFLVVAVGCTAMMALMMRGMHDGGKVSGEPGTPRGGGRHDEAR